MNREAQQYLGDNPTDEQISNVHNMLEALRWICPRWLAELSSGGTDENEGSQYSHVLDEDKRALAALLRACNNSISQPPSVGPWGGWVPLGPPVVTSS